MFVRHLDETCPVVGHAEVPDVPHARPGYSIARKRARVQIGRVVWIARGVDEVNTVDDVDAS